jgi:hypothetical protein
MSSTENRIEWSKENVLRVTWQAPETYFKIPTLWELKDIEVRWGKLFYKGVEQGVEEVHCEGDCKRPVDMDLLADDAAQDCLDMFD